MNNIFSDDSGLYSKDEKDVVNFVVAELFQPAKNYRQKTDMRWYIYNSYYDGNSWIMYSKANGRIENIYLEEWRAKFSVPDIFVAHRSIKALILNKNPIYDVVPTYNDSGVDLEDGPMDPATGKRIGKFKEGPKVSAAKKAGQLLTYWEKALLLPMKRDAVCDDALKMGNGYLKIGFDQDADNGKGDVSVIRCSPFSLYVDPTTTDMATFESCRYVIYVVPRDVKYIELMYNKKVEADNKVSSSSYESLYKQQKLSVTDKTNSSSSSVLVYEAWINEPYQDQLPSGETVVRYRMRCITCTQSVLLRDVYDPLAGNGKDFNEFPFETYQVNCTPGDIYADGIIKQQKDLIDRANRGLSQAADNAARMSNPRIMAPRGSVKPDEFNDIPGSVTEFTVGNGGERPEIIPGANVGTDVMNLADLARKMGQDAAGIHDVSRGVLPPGISSGRQLELAQSADTMVLGPYIRDLESFLKRVAVKMLKIARNKYPTQKEMVLKGARGQLTNLKIAPDDIDFSDVDVQVSSFLANTKAGRQDALLDLSKAGALDPETLLEYYEFPDIDAIIDRLHEHKDLLAQQGGQGQPGQQPGSPPQAPQPQRPLPSR